MLQTQRAVSLKKHQACIGKTFEVLFENRSKRDENRFIGRTREYKRVVASHGEDLCGIFRRVKITSAADETLLGEVAEL